MFGFRDISHDVCNVLIHVSDLRSLYVSFTFHRMSLHTCVRLKKMSRAYRSRSRGVVLLSLGVGAKTRSEPNATLSARFANGKLRNPHSRCAPPTWTERDSDRGPSRGVDGRRTTSSSSKRRHARRRFGSHRGNPPFGASSFVIGGAGGGRGERAHTSRACHTDAHAEPFGW